MYSSVLGDFVITQLDENKQLHRYDTKGNTYTQQQVDSLLPSLYVRQLTADERFPDTICGKAVSPKDIQLTNFTFKSVPSAINASQTGLYFLMESMSKRVDLKMPEDAFRFTDKGIEFIRMETNCIDEAKRQIVYGYAGSERVCLFLHAMLRAIQLLVKTMMRDIWF